ncbi:hypothetical protein GOP47_0029498 [Adiantum capillus-veneris]|nr:hypothetical protein GOP47_0029498 [Adiantum capillus-veneris]
MGLFTSAILGSHLASTSQLLGASPPPSPHFTCQRCESILQVGINCSIRVRSRKRKKQRSASKETSPPVNCILYYCQYCAFENMNIGTPKAYVKTKLSEMAARHKLSELSKSNVEKKAKTSNKELMTATKVLSIEGAGSSGKKTKRKGWLSLKELAASPGLSSTSIRPVVVKSTISTLTPPRMKNLDSVKLMPMFSQMESMAATPVSSIKEQCPTGVNSTKANFELEQCNTSAGEISSEKASDLVHLLRDRETSPKKSSLFTAKLMCLNASRHQQQRGLSDSSGEALNSRHCVECVHPINNIKEEQTSQAPNSQRKLGQSGVAMEVENKEQLSINPAAANAIILDELTVTLSDSKHNNLTSATLDNSYIVSQIRSASVPDVPTGGGALKLLQSFSEKEQGVLTFEKPTKLFSRWQDDVNKLQDKSGNKVQLPFKKREFDDDNRSQKVAKKQKPMVPTGYIDMTRGKVTTNLVLGREFQSKMTPLFRRMGRHWFTKCRSRTIKWRLI